MPEILRRDGALNRTRQARDEHELGARQIDRLAPAGKVIVLVLDSQISVVVHVFAELIEWRQIR